jgi:hypothetical protein
VRRELASAAAAERIADRFIEVAARTTTFLREVSDLILGQVHRMLFSHNFSR